MIRHITASRRIDALPASIYCAIADYHDGHRRIVPPRAFSWLAVDKGGIGAGTEIRFGMRMFGSMRTVRGVVTEPSPGACSSSLPDTGDVTTFIVRRGRTGASNVTITTDLHVSDGSPGAFKLHGGAVPAAVVPRGAQRLADLAEGHVRHDPVPQQPQA
jgi:hypothetical protein